MRNLEATKNQDYIAMYMMRADLRRTEEGGDLVISKRRKVRVQYRMERERETVRGFIGEMH